jgi:nicotinate-nucleotide adenylyltransferase
MRVGLYGGCFNPVHHGHLAAARGAMQALGLNRVLFIPSGNPPLKGDSGLASGLHRLAMLNAALAEEPDMAASAIELDREGPSFTVDTVIELRATLPAGTELFFLLGDDCAARLPRWKGIDRLHAMLRFAILPRTADRPVTDDDRLIWLEFPRVDMSSTQIRAMLAAGEQPTESLVPGRVAEYIVQQGLYASPVEPSYA